ncbi:MAG TPA: acyltransferase [Acidobacteriaceae bacterium]|nr:acyltransferase [Acidobacteriaceae bacterium]
MGQLTGVLDVAPVGAARTQRRFYQPELDGLRFYAFLGVFVCHTLPFEGTFYRRFHLPMPWLWGAVAKSGAAGVDLFFALSAFLITSILLREREETGGISLRRFYLRRILRIWPLYFLLIALGVVLAHTVAKQSLPWYYVAGYLLFVGNWVHAVFGRPESICSPLWTVSIEEQFYLIWPLLMKMLGRRGMIVAGIVTFLLASVSRIGFMLAGSSGGFLYYGSTSRCDSLALGILLALFADRLPRLTRGARVLLLATGLMGWVISSAWLNEQPGPVDMRMVLGRLIVSLAAGAILYACLRSHSRLVRGAWVVRLGKISYGLYMLHLTGILIMLKLFHPVWGWQLLAAKGLGFVMTVILALASYRWIESPFLRLKDKFAIVLSRPV